MVNSELAHPLPSAWRSWLFQSLAPCWKGSMDHAIPTQSGTKGRNLALEAASRPTQVDRAPNPHPAAQTPFVFFNIPASAPVFHSGPLFSIRFRHCSFIFSSYYVFLPLDKETLSPQGARMFVALLVPPSGS